DGENVIIKISDTGKGIPPEIINDIFKPFYTTKPDGSGIGLSLVKEFVKANSGKIDVKSEVNKGTEFTITFPVPHNL
ncbi:MAG: PAS domain-containing sensor histidine kinase, partial [Candidatus Omnitrophota bacterium]